MTQEGTHKKIPNVVVARFPLQHYTVVHRRYHLQKCNE